MSHDAAQEYSQSATFEGRSETLAKAAEKYWITEPDQASEGTFKRLLYKTRESFDARNKIAHGVVSYYSYKNNLGAEIGHVIGLPETPGFAHCLTFPIYDRRKRIFDNNKILSKSRYICFSEQIGEAGNGFDALALEIIDLASRFL